VSDPIKHECGLAFVRLLKPLSYYQKKYGSPLYGLNKLQLLMGKQLNRGQDGAGLTVIKLDPSYGNRYIARKRSAERSALAEIFEDIKDSYLKLDSEKREDVGWLKKQFPYAGELYLGHLRYGTHGKNSIENIHPFLRQNNWMSRNLVLAGNFNMTNVREMYRQLIELGQHPKEISDNVTMLEKIGHFLDEENERLFHQYRAGTDDNLEIAAKIKANLDLVSILKKSFKSVDGGYHLVGMIGDGNSFVIRDPNGIRPSFYYSDDEVFVAASERPAIQTAFNVKIGTIKEIPPGHAVVLDRAGQHRLERILPEAPQKSCSFERIYFSRGSDASIYTERKELGKRLSDTVLEQVDHDVENTVFSYIPNTASTCFYGLVDGVYDYVNELKKQKISELDPSSSDYATRLESILGMKARREKVLIKDAKMRTFITQDKEREDLVANVYDVTYGIVNRDQDTLVVVDDSIVRGTTLRTSILKILDRLGPKRILVASSAPIIKYPDCYGIDMSRMNEFVAFRAALHLLEKRGEMHVLDRVYEECKRQLELPDDQIRNAVKDLYDRFTDEELTQAIATLVRPDEISAEVDVVYQKVEDLHKACPNHVGDWYFTGNYPTPGGTRVVNRSFIYYMEGKKDRAY
jgi:amidophosphoribosyltransferase